MVNVRRYAEHIQDRIVEEEKKNHKIRETNNNKM